MKQSMKAVLAATVVLGTASSVSADQTISGAVGLPLNPTAQIPQAGGARVQGNYFDLGGGGVDAKTYGIYGAMRAGGSIEINGGYSKFSTSPNSAIEDDGFAIGAKYLISRETEPAGVRIAVGAGHDQALLKNTYGYVVASKYLGEVTGDKVPITGHLGVRYDRFKASGLAKSSKASIFAGAEVPITRNGDFAFVGELQSKNNEYNNRIPYSASVRYRPQGQGFSASAGIARQGLTGDNGLFVQLGYTFDTANLGG
jgi:hypothetical protein